MGFKVRVSKFRHLYGEPARKEHCYENITLTQHAHDGNFCCVNPKYIAVVTEAGGGGAFIVLPVSQTGRIPINSPKVCGHSSSVLDIKWNPFKDNIIASSSEDCTVKIWEVPEGGLKKNLTDWQVDLHGHGRRVGYIEWHPTAENILLSSGLDYKCIIWNVEQAEPVNIIDCHKDIIFSMSWNRDGSLFSTTSKDKVLRLIDPRAGQCVQESKDIFNSVRPMKSVFLGDTGKVLCTGFNGTGSRDIAIWDIRNMQKSLSRKGIDQNHGILTPFYDHDTRVVFTAGKGDGNIQFYEMVDDDPYFHYLNSYGSSSPQRGLGVMPKRGCNTEKCEIMRFYKLHSARNFVEPISMIVPRKSSIFHEDIYPPTTSTIPSLTSDEWISGQNRDPILISMKDRQVVNDPKIVPSIATRPQNGALNQAPTITTFKASTSQQMASGTELVPGKKQEVKRIPASVKNIKRLSTCDDIITLEPKKESIESSNNEIQTKVDTEADTKKTSVSETEDEVKTDQAFVNRKIAAFENKGNSSVNEQTVTSPRRRSERKSWSATPDNPPDLIANGMKGHNVEKARNSSPVTVRNAAQYFEHKEIEIIDLQSETKPDSTIDKESGNVTNSAKKPNKPDLQLSTESRNGNHSSGEKTEVGNLLGEHKIHIKKTWSPIKPPSNPIWEDNSVMPNTDPELRKAYFRQVEEIGALKEQLSLKDKRIRQLEDEITILRKGGSSDPQAESEC